MFFIHRLSDGQFLRGRQEPPPFDATTEGIAEYQRGEEPKPRLERYDGMSPTKKRLATTQEVAAYDAALAARRHQVEIDDAKMLKAVVLWTAQRFGITPAQARQEIMAIRETL